MNTEYQPTSNPCVFIKDGQLFLKLEGGTFVPYPYGTPLREPLPVAAREHKWSGLITWIVSGPN
jgi:hypothetical protein